MLNKQTNTSSIPSDVVTRQRHPESTHFISEHPDPSSNDLFDFQAFHFIGVLCNQIAELQPQLVPGLSLFGYELFIIQNLARESQQKTSKPILPVSFFPFFFCSRCLVTLTSC